MQLPFKMEVSRQLLSSGWSFRDRDGDDWMPVPVVPSVVQQDLIANKKWVMILHLQMAGPAINTLCTG